MIHFVVTFLVATASPDGVGLDDLLVRVRATHPLFTREARRAEVERLARDAAYGGEDWLLRASGRYAYQNPPQTNPFVPTAIHTSAFDIGLERRLFSTGGRFGVSVYDNRLQQSFASSLPFELPTVLYESRVQVVYEQPLLKNLAGTLDRLPIELGRHAIEIAELSAAENQEAFLVQVGTRYIDWCLAEEQARIAAARLTLAEEQLAQAERKRAANLVDRVEVLRNADAVQAVKQMAVLLASQSAALRADLAVVAQDEALLNRQPAHDLYAVASLSTVGATLEELRASSRVLRQTRALRDQAELQRGAAEELTQPDLLLGVGAGLLGADERLGDTLESFEPEANVTLTFQVPLGNTAAQAELERRRVLLKQLDESLAEVELRLEAALRGLWVRLEKMQHVLELDRAQIESAKERAAEELRLYNRGRGQLTFVIAAQDGVARAESNYADNGATYQRLHLQLRELVDSLLSQ